MKSVGPLIDQAERLDDVEPEAVEALERLRSVLALCGKRLGGIDTMAISPAPLDSIAASLEQQKVAIEAFIADRDLAHLTVANGAADSALVNLAQVPSVSSSEELIGLMRAVASYRDVIDEQLRSGAASRRETQEHIGELTKNLEDMKVYAQTTLAELKTQLEAERQKISSQAAEQQKAFAEAQESRVNTLTKTLTDQQGQFSAAQENRNRDFTTAQTEAPKRDSGMSLPTTRSGCRIRTPSLRKNGAPLLRPRI